MHPCWQHSHTARTALELSVHGFICGLPFFCADAPCLPSNFKCPHAWRTESKQSVSGSAHILSPLDTNESSILRFVVCAMHCVEQSEALSEPAKPLWSSTNWEMDLFLVSVPRLIRIVRSLLPHIQSMCHCFCFLFVWFAWLIWCFDVASLLFTQLTCDDWCLQSHSRLFFWSCLFVCWLLLVVVVIGCSCRLVVVVVGLSLLFGCHCHSVCCHGLVTVLFHHCFILC